MSEKRCRNNGCGDAGKPAVQVYADAEALGEDLARDMLARIGAAVREGRGFLLGCPGGRSLRSTYLAMGRQAGAARADLSHVVIVMMDEYVLREGTGFVACQADAHYSCSRFARKEIRDVLNAALPPARQVAAENVWLPDPRDPSAYETRLRGAGGFDVFLIASGASDGHVAFNPPGTGLESATRIIELPETTRRDNLRTFPEFRGLNEVPRHGVSVGLGTIAGLSRGVVLVIHGPDKRGAVTRLMACGGFDPAWPASVIFRCRKPRILLDQAAGKDWKASQ